MHLNPYRNSNVSRSESSFRSAFDRLKQNQPQLLPKNSPVTQNNVAREAGLDPSALKKSRFPELISEIQAWISEHGSTMSNPSRNTNAEKKRRSRDLKDRIESLKAQRDNLLNLLTEADARILELTNENLSLKSKIKPENISPFQPRKIKGELN